jgi:hypothetical protein
MRILILALAFAAGTLGAQTPSYRHRLLGVFDASTGEPIEGAEVSDALEKTTALTTKTGTVTLAFLPEGGSLVQIRKVGYAPQTMMIAISPADTVPLTVLLTAARTLPTVVTTDTARKYLSPALREFEERRRGGIGHFIADSVLRRQENRTTMTNIVRQFPSITITCPTKGLRTGQCWASTARVAGLGGGCPVQVYVDGVQSTDNDLEKLKVIDFAGVEFYQGGAEVPAKYNSTGSACGVMLFWTRER